MHTTVPNMLNSLLADYQEHYDKVHRHNAEQIAIAQAQVQARAQAQAQIRAKKEAQMKAQARAQAQLKAQVQAQREAQMHSQMEAQRETQDQFNAQQTKEQAKCNAAECSEAKLGAQSQSQVCPQAQHEAKAEDLTYSQIHPQEKHQEVPEVELQNRTSQDLDEEITAMLQDFLDGTIELRGNGIQFIDEFFGSAAEGKETTEQVTKESSSFQNEARPEDADAPMKVPSEATVLTVPVVANLSDDLWADVEAALVAEVLDELPPRPRGEREEWAANTGWGAKEDTRPDSDHHRRHKHRHSQDRHNQQQHRRRRDRENFARHATRKPQV